MGKTVNLPSGWERRLEDVATFQRRSAHAIMVDVIQDYVERAEQRKKYLEEAEAARTHYLETGLHVTGKEMIAWLETIGTANEMEPPKCHP